MKDETELAAEPGTDARVETGTDMGADMGANTGVGAQLARARAEAGLTLEQIADETRIPQRHLEVIESGRFEELPARTYAIGFSRTYARTVGLDEREIAARVRDELGEGGTREIRHVDRFQPGDPARVPSRKLAWFSAFAVILLVAGGFAFFGNYFFPGSGPGPITQDAQIADATAGEPAAQTGADDRPTGPVVFTSMQDGVWVKFYDAAGERLMEKEMAQGERYRVPADADGPQVWTGQPEALMVSIGGEDIGTLSRESEILRDIPATATALVDRIGQDAAQGDRTPSSGAIADRPAAG